MRSSAVFRYALIAMGVGFVIAGMLHVVFGLAADQMLGAGVSAQSLSDPGLDSQNRFYGAAFTLYGVLLIVISRDVERYALILRCVMWVFLFAGAARLISVVLYGWPPPLMGALLAVELILPPAILVWQSRLATSPSSRHPR